MVTLIFRPQGSWSSSGSAYAPARDQVDVFVDGFGQIGSLSAMNVMLRGQKYSRHHTPENLWAFGTEKTQGLRIRPYQVGGV